MTNEKQFMSKIIPDHIQKLVDEAETVPVDSKQYWKLRAIYLQRAHDPTYSEMEKYASFMLHRVLENRLQ